ncbi:MAG: zinc ribbon domain-containing protein [Dehalococcoidales bacterium]|nr:zinc ribbon domain-containing protein [Dehalococcoidales bacterium]
MPIYEYECGKCRCRFELRQGFDSKPVTTCSACGGEARRVLHPAPILFKAGGFYITESRKGKEPREDLPKPAAPKVEAAKADTPKADSTKDTAKGK